MDDIYKELEYWVNYFGFEVKDKEELFKYILENYVKDKEGVIEEYVEVMEIKVPDLRVLDKDYIIDNDMDYEEIGEDMYLNIFWLEDDERFLRKNDLIK